jgi:hypothetical protein
LAILALILTEALADAHVAFNQKGKIHQNKNPKAGAENTREAQNIG